MGSSTVDLPHASLYDSLSFFFLSSSVPFRRPAMYSLKAIHAL